MNAGRAGQCVVCVCVWCVLAMRVLLISSVAVCFLYKEKLAAAVLKFQELKNSFGN